jgi:hypothetical protein
MDAVSADAVGRFPDANAAEALRRIPGVAMEIDQNPPSGFVDRHAHVLRAACLRTQAICIEAQ